ncbi:MAG: site-2 protease family protein [Clostridia bacterium]|nr:site-2 protease family protein [Clostridia bacterium]
MSTVLYVLAAILLLSILIAVHEGGHFLAARLTGIPVREYAIGMGPKIFSRTSKKSGIVFSLRAVPMGGFCAFYGEDDPDAKAQDDPRAFSRQKLWKRIVTVLMGPGMNFILAFAVLLLSTWILGVSVPVREAGFEPLITDVAASGAAKEAGIRPGDFITAINGQAMLVYEDEERNPFSDAISGWKEGDAPLVLTVRRGRETADIAVTPHYVGETGRMMIDIGYGYYAVETKRAPVGIWDGVRVSWDDFTYFSGAIFNAVIGIFKGENLDQVSGPVGAVTQISEQVRQSGFDAFIQLLAFISVNLGIVNLLPIPALDGSRILFMLIEGVRGKPIPPEKEAVVHLAGMALLIVVFVILTVRDVGRLF